MIYYFILQIARRQKILKSNRIKLNQIESKFMSNRIKIQVKSNQNSNQIDLKGVGKIKEATVGWRLPQKT